MVSSNYFYFSHGNFSNTDKMEYMCFNQRGDISTLNDGSLK